MKVLVTGATGFVGNHAARRLLSQGYSVRCLVRKTSRLNGLKALDAELCCGDVNDKDSLRRALRGVDAVLHLASLVGETGRRQDFFRVNVEGTRNLLEVCGDVPLKKLIHMSSLSVITGDKDHHGTPEDAPYLRTGEPYADTKIESERLVLQYRERYPLPAVILRPGFIYGPGDRLFLPAVIKNLREGKVILIDGGKKILNLTHIDNLLDAVELALSKQEADGETFNITDGEKISKREFFFTVADLINLPRPARSIPFFVARAVCSAAATLYQILGIQKTPRLSRIKLRFAGQNQLFSIEKAEKVLGYVPRIRFQAGIREAVESCRDQIQSPAAEISLQEKE